VDKRLFMVGRTTKQG